MERKYIPFPDCSQGCVLVEYFGVGECESFCPYKFDDAREALKEPHKP
jgi:hypothetical protein